MAVSNERWCTLWFSWSPCSTFKQLSTSGFKRAFHTRQIHSSLRMSSHCSFDGKRENVELEAQWTFLPVFWMSLFGLKSTDLNSWCPSLDKNIQIWNSFSRSQKQTVWASTRPLVSSWHGPTSLRHRLATQPGVANHQFLNYFALVLILRTKENISGHKPPTKILDEHLHY